MCSEIKCCLLWFFLLMEISTATTIVDYFSLSHKILKEKDIFSLLK